MKKTTVRRHLRRTKRGYVPVRRHKRKVKKIKRKNRASPPIEDYLDIDLKRKLETKGKRVSVFPQDDKVVVSEKDLHPAGFMKDLFKEGDHFVIKSRRGDVVREIKKKGDKVSIDPKSGNPGDIIEVDLNEELIYEPWFMDAGSILFKPDQKKAPPGLKGQFLKLATEGDDIEYVKKKDKR